MAHTVKVNFQGTSRDVQLASPFTVTGLRSVVAWAFELEDGTNVVDNLRFTFRDSDGDEIVFDSDAELSLAMRLYKGNLCVTATAPGAGDGQVDPPARADVSDIYEAAAAELTTSRGVPSITAAKLRNTMAILQLHPRRLVAQGLAPPHLLQGHDGAPPSSAPAAPPLEASPGQHAAGHGDQSADDPLCAALAARGVSLPPGETRALLRALGVRPHRLVKLGVVDGRELRAFMIRSRGGRASEVGHAETVGQAGEMYEVAAGELRRAHGVASMTGPKLEKTMALLQLQPRRLVSQGLAPRRLMKAQAVAASAPAGGDEQEQTEDEQEQAKDKQEQRKDKQEQTKDEQEVVGEAEQPVGKDTVHTALAAGVVSLEPHETGPLLLALGVRPRRLVRLGLVRREAVGGVCAARVEGHAGRAQGRGHGRGRGGGHGRGGRFRPLHGRVGRMGMWCRSHEGPGSHE